jgi:hypothetical protein
MNSNETKILIGGQKLRTLGSDRYTDDTDYLVFRADDALFIHEAGCDFVNAAANGLLRDVWETEINDDKISLSGLAVLCGWAMVNHCQNFNFRKADAKEYDLKFLTRISGGKLDLSILRKHLASGEMAEIEKVISEVRIEK